ncbi:MAG: hypothetical protein AMXMBFR84_04510 [Candidatus Hydrogenedentota bacterium]
MLHKNTRIVTGGGIPLVGAASVHRQIVALAGVRRPKAVLLPTATYDKPEAVAQFHHTYGKRLGCETREVLLLGREPDLRVGRRLLESADIIYVTGGNTLKALRRWRHLGVDALLHRAHRRGTLLAGSSAGGICWYDLGHSDSMSFYHPEHWDYIAVKGLGMLPVTACPHVMGERRMESFRALIHKRGGVGIGIDDHCAIAYVGNTYRVLRTHIRAKAYTVVRRLNQVETREVKVVQGFSPVSELFAM